MKFYTPFLVFALMLLLPALLPAQQHVAVISRCGGIDTVIIPNIVDRDSDGMDDALEQMLLNKFMPAIMMFSNETCPGPALNGTGDTNLVAARISPYPGQYTRSTSLDSVLIHPYAVVASKQLTAGLIWYDPFIMVHCAVLYGQDCGALGHNADVEGFHFSLKYIGPDTIAGWMYDTVMSNWMGLTIQSISHDATLCQHIETRQYKSAVAPTGVDSVYASPNKHGNYLTIGDCDASFICNPNCDATQIRKNVTNVNLGEPWASLVPDLGTYYPAYAGNDPWGTANFLAAQSGNAGTIAAKMERALTSDFATGQTLTAQQICPIYARCFNSGSAILAYTCASEPYGFYDQSLTTAGTYTHSLTTIYGCDSTVTLTLGIYPSSVSAYNDVTCQGRVYNFGGQQLSGAGVYYDTLSNANGCDSVVTLTLSVIALSTHTLVDSFCPGSTYNFNGQQLSSAGIYTDTLNSASGCDSIITLNLNSESPPVVSWSSSTDSILAGSSPFALSGGMPPGGSYTGAGVWSNTFYPDSAGTGQHIVTYTYSDGAGCSNTATKTFVVLALGMHEIFDATDVHLYPNPVNNTLVLESALFSAADVKPVLYDITGKRVFVNYDRNGDKITFNVSALAEGTYWLRFNMQGYEVCRKFVKLN